MKYGVVVGKFYPLHRGHVDLIQKASTQVDRLFVVVSHSDSRDQKLFEDSKMKKGLTAKDKLKIVQKTFQLQKEIITPVLVDESAVPAYPHGWLPWSKLVVDAVESHRNVPVDLDWNSNVYFFSSEPQDAEGYLQYFGAKTILIDPDRAEVNISATMVRNDPAKYWDYLPRASREALAPVVVIAGGESSGKTFMTEKLGNYFGTTTVWEFGRSYCDLELGGDESALQFSDYGVIANGHYQDVRFAKRNANRFVISDTDYVATQNFCIMYENQESNEVENFIVNDPFDLVILLDNSTPWVNDGMRLIGDDERRKAFQDSLKMLYNRYSIPYVEVTASDFETRYELCKKIVHEYIYNKVSVKELQYKVDNEWTNQEEKENERII